MNRRRDKVIYWTTTAIVCAVMTFSVVQISLDRPLGAAGAQNGEGAFAHLGLPHWFKIELTIAKVLGLLALLVPGIPPKPKEFAYFGFAITLISASIAHFSSGDPPMFIVDPLIFWGILSVSYGYFRRLKRTTQADTLKRVGPMLSASSIISPPAI
jgi:hypothetical protein